VRRDLAILALTCLLTLFAGLGRGAISDSDEAFYAEASREIVQSRDWLTPRYNYEPRFQKPILYYWAAALAFEIAGVSEAAARFPAALAGLGLVLVTYACGRRWVRPRVGLIAGLIVATNFGYFLIGRLALPDLPLSLFICVATWAGLEVLRPAPTGAGAAGSRRWLLVASAAAALGCLTKGPVGLALPALVVGCALLFVRQGRSSLSQVPVSRRDVALAMAAFVILAAPWYAAMTAQHGVAYLHRFFVDENVQRFVTDRYNDRRPFGLYVPIVVGGLLPWSPFMWPWIAAGIRIMRHRAVLEPDEWRLILWAGLPLAFYSLSVGQQPRYILPILPPLAILLARSIDWRLDRAAAERRRVDPTLAWSATAGGLVLLALGLLLHRGRPLLDVLNPVVGRAGVAAVVAGGLAVVVVAWVGRPRHLVGTVTVASTITLLSLHYSVYSAAGPEPVQRIAAAVSQQRQAGEPVGAHRVLARNLVFYTGVRQTPLPDTAAVVEFLRSPRRVLCVLGERDLTDVEAHLGTRVRRLTDIRYLNPARLRLRSLLWPDPARDVETVVLVDNR
jgi:4-amino-4-deoxy-L-arabinose transferase-like glycosyltransferase